MTSVIKEKSSEHGTEDGSEDGSEDGPKDGPKYGAEDGPEEGPEEDQEPELGSEQTCADSSGARRKVGVSHCIPFAFSLEK